MHADGAHLLLQLLARSGRGGSLDGASQALQVRAQVLVGQHRHAVAAAAVRCAHRPDGRLGGRGRQLARGAEGRHAAAAGGAGRRRRSLSQATAARVDKPVQANSPAEVDYWIEKFKFKDSEEKIDDSPITNQGTGPFPPGYADDLLEEEDPPS